MKHIRLIKGRFAQKLSCIGFNKVRVDVEMDGDSEMHLINFEAPVGFCQIRFWDRGEELGGASVMVWPKNPPKPGKKYYYLGHWSAPDNLDWENIGSLLWKNLVEQEVENREKGMTSWIPDAFLYLDPSMVGKDILDENADPTSPVGLSTEVQVDEGSVLGMFGG